MVGHYTRMLTSVVPRGGTLRAGLANLLRWTLLLRLLRLLPASGPRRRCNLLFVRQIGVLKLPGTQAGTIRRLLLMLPLMKRPILALFLLGGRGSRSETRSVACV